MVTVFFYFSSFRILFAELLTVVRVVFVPHFFFKIVQDYDWVFVFFVPGRKNAVVQKIFVLGFWTR